MKIALYPGSFDPITNGHIDILKNAAEIFDTVVIAVAHNYNKKGFLTADERVELIKKCCKDFPNVRVDKFSGLTIDYAKQIGANVIIRGLRAVSDFEFEMQLSQTNNALSPEVKTVFLTTKPEYNFISSSAIREILYNNGDISKFVPESVDEFLKDYKRNSNE